MKLYTIKKGRHYSTPRRFGMWVCKREFNFKFMLFESCWYPNGSIPIEGISKIVGVSFGIHAEKPFGKIPVVREFVNSCVLGFEPCYEHRNKFKLYAINDNRGVETRPFFRMIEAKKLYECKIKIVEGGVEMSIENSKIKLPMNTWKFGYHLGFYHGGRSVAPQDMYMLLK